MDFHWVLTFFLLGEKVIPVESWEHEPQWYRMEVCAHAQFTSACVCVALCQRSLQASIGGGQIARRVDVWEAALKLECWRVCNSPMSRRARACACTRAFLPHLGPPMPRGPFRYYANRLGAPRRAPRHMQAEPDRESLESFNKVCLLTATSNYRLLHTLNVHGRLIQLMLIQTIYTPMGRTGPRSRPTQPWQYRIPLRPECRSCKNHLT